MTHFSDHICQAAVTVPVYMCHDSFIWMPWLIHLCSMTSSHICHDSCIHVTRCEPVPAEWCLQSIKITTVLDGKFRLYRTNGHMNLNYYRNLEKDVTLHPLDIRKGEGLHVGHSKGRRATCWTFEKAKGCMLCVGPSKQYLAEKKEKIWARRVLPLPR